MQSKQWDEMTGGIKMEYLVYALCYTEFQQMFHNLDGAE